MRMYRSYLALMARSTLYKELLLLVGMAVVELALFVTKMPERIESITAITAEGEEIWMSQHLMIPEIVEDRRLVWVWLVALLLLSVILIHTAGQWRDYTLDRLGLSRKQGNLLYAAYSTLAFVLLWAFQAALCVVMCLLYRQDLPADQVTLQTVLLSIYRTPLFFTVLPLASWVRWGISGMVMVALGLCAASGARLRRLGRRPMASVELVILLAMCGFGHTGVSEMNADVLQVILAVCFGGVAAGRMTVWDDGGDREEDPDEPLHDTI